MTAVVAMTWPWAPKTVVSVQGTRVCRPAGIRVRACVRAGIFQARERRGGGRGTGEGGRQGEGEGEEEGQGARGGGRGRCRPARAA
jgi:uncharacterized membrane protein YgcG